MKTCRHCGLEKQDREFARTRTICYPCKYVIAGGSKHDPVYMHAYYNKHKNDLKYKAYRHGDKKRECVTVDKEAALLLMGQPCHYCGLTPCAGLDRKDSAEGHTASNVVSCLRQM